MKNIITLKQIEDYVTNQYGLDLRNKTRKAEYVDARSLYYKLSRELTRLSLGDIGASLGRPHSSVLHALNNTIHYIKESQIIDGYIFFNAKHKFPKESYEFLEISNNKIKKDLDKKNAVLSLIPKLERVYNSLNGLNNHQSNKIYHMKNIQFNTINRSLERIQEMIEVEIGG